MTVFLVRENICIRDVKEWLLKRVVGEAMRHVDKGTGDTGRTPEDDLVGGSERLVDKEAVGCDVGVTKEDDLVGGSERQVDKETVGCDVGVTKEEGLISGSERQVNKATERSHIGGTQGEGLVCGIEKQDARMIERCGGLQSEVRTERDIKQNDELTVGMYVLVVYDHIKYPGLVLKTKRSEVQVQCMEPIQQSASEYQWPKHKDICWYFNEDIVKIIPNSNIKKIGNNKYSIE